MPSETGWNQEPAAGTTCQCPCPFHPIKTGAWRTCGHVRSKWPSGVARLIRSLSLRLPQGMASQICASGFPSASYSGSSQESVPCNSLLPRNRFENSAQVRQKFFQNHRLEPKFLRVLLTTPLHPPYPAPKVSLQNHMYTLLPCAERIFAKPYVKLSVGAVAESGTIRGSYETYTTYRPQGPPAAHPEKPTGGF